MLDHLTNAFRKCLDVAKRRVGGVDRWGHLAYFLAVAVEGSGFYRALGAALFVTGIVTAFFGEAE